MKFYFKKTIWEQVEVDDDDEAEVEAGIKDGSITTTNDIYELGLKPQWENDLETEEYMNPKDNNGMATITIEDNIEPAWESKTMWNNVTESELEEVSEEDIIDVAKSLKINPTDYIVAYVQTHYAGEVERDTGATFDLIIENLLNTANPI